MRKTLSALLLGGLLCFPGCVAGPHQLFRSVDDFDARVYTDSPWLSSLIWVVPLIPLARMGASIGDFFIGDMYWFWFEDAWDGKGTGFEHAQYLGTDGHVKSLLLDGGEFLEVSPRRQSQ